MSIFELYNFDNLINLFISKLNFSKFLSLIIFVRLFLFFQILIFLFYLFVKFYTDNLITSYVQNKKIFVYFFFIYLKIEIFIII